MKILPNILILHGMNIGNKGDTAIVKATIARLKAIIPNAEITLLSNTRSEAKQKIPGAKVQENIIVYNNGCRSKYFITRLTLQLLVNLQIFFYMCGYSFWALVYRISTMNMFFLIGKEKQKTLQEYIRADVIISRGGGFLTDADISITGHGRLLNSIITEWTFLFHLYSVFFAVLMGKRTVIYAQSIGPFKSRLNAYLTKFVLNKVDIIMVRERISKEWLKKIDVNRLKIYVTADEAFLLEPTTNERVEEILFKEGIKRNNTLLIGVNVRKWFVPDSKNPLSDYKRYIKAVTDCVNYLTEALNAMVIFIPQSPGDIDVGQEIYLSIRKKGKVKCMNSYSPDEMKGIIGKMDLFIGTHMHSSIFALSMCIPTIVISYSYLHKTMGIMKMMGLEEQTLSIKDLGAPALILKINDTLSMKDELCRKIAYNLEKIQKRAELNAKLVKSIIENDKGKCTFN